eukprot:203603-Prorocentrum_minimum.AAC.1
MSAGGDRRATGGASPPLGPGRAPSLREPLLLSANRNTAGVRRHPAPRDPLRVRHSGASEARSASVDSVNSPFDRRSLNDPSVFDEHSHWSHLMVAGEAQAAAP